MLCGCSVAVRRWHQHPVGHVPSRPSVGLGFRGDRGAMRQNMSEDVVKQWGHQQNLRRRSRDVPLAKRIKDRFQQEASFENVPSQPCKKDITATWQQETEEEARPAPDTQRASQVAVTTFMPSLRQLRGRFGGKGVLMLCQKGQ